MNHIDLQTFLMLLRKFINLQSSLVSDYLALAAIEGSWPRKGLLNSMGGRWEFTKHGAGVRFRNVQTREEIDAHTGMEQAPQAFDEWRLDIYFSSIDRVVVDIEKNEFDLHSDRDIKGIIDHLLHSNLITQISDIRMYELR